MKRLKKIGYILLQVSACLIILGGISDFMMTILLDSLPPAHATYLKVNNPAVSNELINFDHAFLRATGGCIIALGIGALTIIYTALIRREKRAIAGLLAMVTIGEGGNAIQMISVDSPYFLFPLACVILMWIAAFLWWYGNKQEMRTNSFK